MHLLCHGLLVAYVLYSSMPSGAKCQDTREGRLHAAHRERDRGSAQQRHEHDQDARDTLLRTSHRCAPAAYGKAASVCGNSQYRVDGECGLTVARSSCMAPANANQTCPSVGPKYTYIYTFGDTYMDACMHVQAWKKVPKYLKVCIYKGLPSAASRQGPCNATVIRPRMCYGDVHLSMRVLLLAYVYESVSVITYLVQIATCRGCHVSLCHCIHTTLATHVCTPTCSAVSVCMHASSYPQAICSREPARSDGRAAERMSMSAQALRQHG
jgi:hypothetical protein